MAIKKINFGAGHANEIANEGRSLSTRVDAAQMYVRLANDKYLDLYDVLEQLNTDLAAEVQRAGAAEAAIQADVDANEAVSVAADASLTTRVAAEEAARAAAITALQADVDQNESDSDAAEASLTTRLAAEESARAAAITALQADVDQNESDSDAAEASLTTRVAAEEAAREAADMAAPRAALSNREGYDIAGDHGLTTYDFDVATVKVNGKDIVEGSELVIMNGMMMERGKDYSVTAAAGLITNIIFGSNVMPADGARIVIMGLAD